MGFIYGTSSTHNGSESSSPHNLREDAFIKNERAKEIRTKGSTHIKENGEHENWHFEDIKDFYKRTFQPAVDVYNAKQKKENRKIADYYEKILFDKKKHTCYEMIVGIYGSEIPPDIGKAITKEFFDGWNERNPNLPLIQVDWHNDEMNKHQNGHGHGIYVPVAHNCKTGPSTGTSLNQAFKEMGFIDKGPLTAQMQWQARENKVLDEIALKYGIVILHGQELEKRKHEKTDDYKRNQVLREQNKNLQEQIERRSESLSGLDRAIEQREKEIAQLNSQIALKRQEMASINQSAESIQKLNEDVKHAINSSKKQPIERLQENPPKYNILGKEKQPATSLVKTAQLDELESSPRLTPSDTWKLDDIHKDIKKVSSTIDQSHEKQLLEKVVSLEQQNRELQIVNRKISNQLQLLKDWVIDIVERELSIRNIASSVVNAVKEKMKSSISSIEKESQKMQSNEEREFE